MWPLHDDPKIWEAFPFQKKEGKKKTLHADFQLRREGVGAPTPLYVQGSSVKAPEPPEVGGLRAGNPESR